MKILLCFLFVITVAACYGDIQDPPVNDYGPTRKLARALANIDPFDAISEVTNTVASETQNEGSPTGASYGVVKGVGRFFCRMGFGWYEFVTFPFPTYKGSYRPFYRDNVPWIHSGFTEFPPEMGFKSQYNYVQENTGN